MINIKQCLKTILDRLIKEKDYIVEQGVSGIWTYRKWNSGIAECWGYKDVTRAVNTAWGGIYTSTGDLNEVFPFTFTKTPSLQASIDHIGSYGAWVFIPGDAIRLTNEQTGNYAIGRPTSAPSQLYRIAFYATGHWK